MKKYAKYTLAATAMLMACNLGAQQVRYIYEMPEQRHYLPIDWTPDRTQGQRFTIGVHPFQLVNNGLKFDFEIELARPGDWIAIELGGYNRAQFDPDIHDGDYFYEDGWGSMLSGYRNFRRLQGFTGGLAFKSMFSPRGWYYRLGASMDYFNVWYASQRYDSYIDGDGIRKYEWTDSQDNTEFFKPTFTFNVGKHFALGRRLFLDGFVGMGYAWNFHRGEQRYASNAYMFGGSGLFLNGGFRIGVLLGR